ncbi:hypothetical protein JMJ55_16690 [Belnapia sp. T6]|uniref:Uncharacterized protein n=1 Tax=Belnapia mucosa TaxID=2804532 RepID=A0ABS1V5L0_9PROT|nr:hypothetical protein [Belnapia mucosa]MBL6456977.1 hypothetical protein [Belnapia mucosa]
MRRTLGLILLLAGCAETPVATPPPELGEVAANAPVLGEAVRAGQACGIPVPVTALDRAARIEAAAIEQREREGGTAARDDFLRAMAPPEFDARHQADRNRWCAARRPEIERATGFLTGPEGSALAQRAEAMRARPR